MADVSVLATRFNNLQARIEAVYGDPVVVPSNFGYGMTTRSFQVGALALRPLSFNSVSAVNYSNNRITIAGHAMANTDRVEYDPNGNDPIIGNLVDDAHYWVKRIDANTIQLYYDESFTDPVDLITGATGTHILNHLDGNLIGADDYFRLYLDIAAARVHQVGSSYTVPNSVILASGDQIAESYITDLETLMIAVEADKDLADSTQLNLETLKDGAGTNVASTRTSSWNGTISHVFNVNFASAAQRVGFFNAGGDIRLSGSLTGGSGLKTGDWRNMFTKAGTTILSKTGVTATGIGPGLSTTSINSNTLTTSYQLLMQQNGANYLDNRYYVYAKLTGPSVVTASTITFKVEYADLDTGGDGLPGGTFGPDPVDENVNGTISSSVSINRPTGTFTVGGVSYTTVDIPVTGLNISTL